MSEKSKETSQLNLDLDALSNEICSLEDYIYNCNRFNKLSFAKRCVLSKQLDIMREYRNILIIRIELEDK